LLDYLADQIEGVGVFTRLCVYLVDESCLTAEVVRDLAAPGGDDPGGDGGQVDAGAALMPLLGFVGQLISLDAEMSSVFPLTAPRIVEGWTPWVDRGDPMIGEDRD
jgi:hypothetical protein